MPNSARERGEAVPKKPSRAKYERKRAIIQTAKEKRSVYKTWTAANQKNEKLDV